MPFENEMKGQDLILVQQGENSREAGTEGFGLERDDQNEDLLQVLMQFLESEQVLDLPRAETDMTSSELDPIPPEKESSEAKNDGSLMLEETENDVIFQEVNEFLDLEEVSQIQSAETTNIEQVPTPGLSSGDNKDMKLKGNNDRGKKEIQDVEMQIKSPAPSETESNDIKKQGHRGKCCECNNVYLRIFDHSRCKHNGKLEKVHRLS